MKFIPYLLVLAFGFLVGALLFRRPETPASDDWEKKYRDLLSRYGDPTRKFQQDGDYEKASRYRQTLWDVRGMLKHPEGLSPQQAKTALEEIDTALKA